MIRRTLESGQHYGVSHSATGKHILLQAEEASGDPFVRLVLTWTEVGTICDALLEKRMAMMTRRTPAGDEGE